MTTIEHGDTVELLQALIRNECVNSGTVESGQEVRNAEVLRDYLGGVGLDMEFFEAAPGRTTLVARIEGRDPSAPSLCLNGHTDVVPVSPEGWSRDPFGGELVDGEVWGRGAVDMLNLTASMAVAIRHLAKTGFRPSGDLVFLAVADEESGSAYGARWMADNHADLITTDYVLTESGGYQYQRGRKGCRLETSDLARHAWPRLDALCFGQRTGQGRRGCPTAGRVPARATLP